MDTKSLCAGLLLGVIITVGMAAADKDDLHSIGIARGQVLEFKLADDRLYQGVLQNSANGWIRLSKGDRAPWSGWINTDHVITIQTLQ